jgi:arylsulfatase A-like enzyme
MPNLARIAERSTVYHAHYSAGNFTIPGTASILTGTYPWTHRGFHLRGSVLDQFSKNNLFHVLRENQYTCFGFSHNMLANMLLNQFQKSIDPFYMPRDVPLVDRNFSDLLFRDDYASAIRSEDAYLNYNGELPNSLFLDLLAWIGRKKHTDDLYRDLATLFPRGVPQNDEIVCILEDTFDWLVLRLKELRNPYFAYIHLIPPHSPYRTRYEFIDLFKDGWEPIQKAEHAFTHGIARGALIELRRWYDEYIAYADAELGRFYDMLSRERLLDNTVLIFTSDHGEMFERGIWEHITETLYEPIIRVPLLVSEPGQVERRDIHTRTSSVDLVPTVLHLNDIATPDWCEGKILPPFSSNSLEHRDEIFAVEAKSNPRVGPLKIATVAMIKDKHKLIKYWGYPDSEDFFEVYDLENDPHELNDLSAVQTQLASELLEVLRLKLERVDTEG